MRRNDLFEHVRPSHVTVVLDDREWAVDLHNAHAWIGAVGMDLSNLSGVFPGGLADSDVDAMYHLSLSLPDIERRWLNCARAALGRGSGRDWWWSLNLIKRVLPGWTYINGKLLLSGVSARGMPLPDWLDAVYMLLWTSTTDEKERIKLDLELSMPPAGVAIRRSKEQKQKMLADFAAD